MIKIIAALSSNRVIGNNGKIPWFIKGELRRFKEITMGHNVVMGRKTFESIGNALEGRKNIIITKNKSFEVNNATVKHSFEAALKACNPAKDIFVIGGSSIYEMALDCCDYLLLTVIYKNISGDTYFPEFDSSHWKLTKEIRHYDTENKFSYSYLTYRPNE